jgi:ferritin-like metal-binding protein YciE
MAKKEAKKLDELFHDTLKDIYFAEKKILATLPKMEKAAQASQLKMAFAKHKTETEGHVARLEKVFAAIDKKPQSKTCDAIVGITDEGAEIMKENTKVRLPSTQAYLRRRKRSSTTKSLATAHSKHGRMSSD